MVDDCIDLERTLVFVVFLFDDDPEIRLYT